MEPALATRYRFSSAPALMMALLFLLSTTALAQGERSKADSPLAFHVGAARVDITPPKDLMPAWYTSVDEPTYVRVILVGNGLDTVALIGVDASSVNDEMYLQLLPAVAGKVGVPEDNVVISGTHSHNAPPPGDLTGPRRDDYTEATAAQGRKFMEIPI